MSSLQVHEEKRQNWEVELREVSEQWENRLKLQQQKYFKTEQALLLQLFKLQQVSFQKDMVRYHHYLYGSLSSLSLWFVVILISRII